MVLNWRFVKVVSPRLIIPWGDGSRFSPLWGPTTYDLRSPGFKLSGVQVKFLLAPFY